MQPRPGRLVHEFTSLLLCLILGLALGGAVSIADGRGWLPALPWTRIAAAVQHVPGEEIRRAIFLRLRPMQPLLRAEDVSANMRSYWEAGHPKRALKLLRGLKDQAVAYAVARDAVGRFRDLDPRFAAEAAISIQNEALRLATLRPVLAEWAALDAEGAWQFLESLPAESLREEMFLGATPGLARLSADRLSGLLLRLRPELRAAVVEGMNETAWQVGAWSNIYELMERLNLRPTDGVVGFQLALHLAEVEPGLAQSWIEQAPPSIARDTLAIGYIRSLEKSDRKLALEWTATLTDDGSTLKAGECARQVRAWLLEDRHTAQVWLQSDEGERLCPLEKRAEWFSGYGIPLLEIPEPSAPAAP